MGARAYIGTSGWNYKHWRNSIYPEGLSQKIWLSHIARHFDTVEVNTSFYRIPKKETIQAWQSVTPPGFVFALKLWRGITHYRKLLNTEAFSRNFLEVAEALEPARRAPLLIQLPPNQSKDLDKLSAYIAELRGLMLSAWRIAVEFRHGSWLSEDTYETLTRINVALCLHDMRGKADTERENGANFIYVRRHGSGEGRYSGSYSPEQIAGDGERIRAWLKEGRDVFVYYNNDIGGHAFRNAKDLKQAITA